ncbi:MAG: DNA gyrase subunit A [Oscillospiraceae bacterium]|nr:DNA gyrase subunit A [Oscillospiraceae bacterium]
MQELEKIIEVNIESEMKRSFMDYAMSVIVSRALPDARDGLKPVHRRILYTLFENNLTTEKPYRKCADTVGSVLGRYHPHGDASVYDAMVRMAQDFFSRYILVDGHGNFGSIDGDPAAAYRYTEARMSKISSEILRDIEKNTVNFVPNYDDRLKEPTVLPSRFPNLLVNGSTGIAVGMATNIPPHNLGEVTDAVCYLIENPECEISDLMNFVKGPDFPTGALIMGHGGIKSAYASGRGKITVRAKTEIVEDFGGRSKIIISEIPYQVNKSLLIEGIASLIKDKRVEGATRIEDHSDRKGMHIEINVKNGASAQVVLNQLFSFSQLQTTFGVICLAIVNGEPKVLNLKQCLEIYLDFQVEVITRRTRFDLEKARERAHLLKGLKVALDNIDEVVDILRSSKNLAEGKERLSERFGLDEFQTQAIVQMPLGRLTGLERGKIESEIEALLKEVSNFESILSDPQKILGIIKEEIKEIKRKYSDERRTEIVAVSGEVVTEDLIPHGEKVVILTKMGYIKAQDMETYKIQRRGGRGVNGMTRREGDFAEDIIVADSHDFVLFFSTFGRIYKLKCFEIPEGSRTSRGISIVNLLPLAQDEKITSFIKTTEFNENEVLVMVTKLGVIKKTKLSAFNSVRKSGVVALDLDEGDELVWVKITDGNQNLLLATRLGKAIRFSENDVRMVGRAARGVRAIRLSEGDVVIGMVTALDQDKILTVSETGYGRISPATDYRLQARGGQGLINYHTEEYGAVAVLVNVHLEDDLIVTSSGGVIIKIHADSVRQCSRPSKGVRIMRVNQDSVASVVAVERDEGSILAEDNEILEDAELRSSNEILQEASAISDSKDKK